MLQDPFQYYRRSLQLHNYHYAQGGVYFVTLCTHNRECILGDIVDGDMQLNDYGKIVREEWVHLEVARPNVLLDEFIIMPNHLHAILVLTGALVGEKRRGVASEYRSGGLHAPVPDSTSAVVRYLQSVVAWRINILRGTPDAPVWQLKYYEHSIRNERALESIREHIIANPGTWDKDENNPAAQKQSDGSKPPSKR